MAFVVVPKSDGSPFFAFKKGKEFSMTHYMFWTSTVQNPFVLLPWDLQNIQTNESLSTQGCLGPLGLVLGTQIHLDFSFPEKDLTIKEYMILDFEFKL
jgi:hypothetical protein